MDDQDCAGFEFYTNFDSANLSKIEFVPQVEPPVKLVPTAVSRNSKKEPEVIDVEFNIWTKPDCFGTEFENGNRTWFYYGIKANASGLMVKLNMVDINRQAKMYSQGMAPVFRVSTGKQNWERIRERPTYNIIDNIFILSFKYKTPENIHSVVYFAFTYPYTYSDLTIMLGSIDNRFNEIELKSRDDIYYTREAICITLDGRRVELITISSYHNISTEREIRLKNLFPEESVPRPFRFIGKKVIFVSARVHPGETPSSFVFNGFLHMLLDREDPVAIALRRMYVFKLIPMLNPDGVAKGHYRTDTRGVNLNRMYLNPSFELHPSIYAARALVRYYHYGYEKEDVIGEADLIDERNDDDDDEDGSSVEDNRQLNKKVSHMSLEEDKKKEGWCNKCKELNIEDAILETTPPLTQQIPFSVGKGMCTNCGVAVTKNSNPGVVITDYKCENGDHNIDSGLFLYMDMHGHASKKGIFMYGNHFEDLDQNVECMLLPKIMSLNNHNFHFSACNFTEKNMYLKDRRDGMSREGSGRVAVLKLTGLVRSYTLECNYNTGRMVNVLPTSIRESNNRTQILHVPPKYTPHIYEEVGKALGPSILDLTAQNPFTRLPNSQFHSLNGVRDWLRIHCMNELGDTRFTATKYKLRNSSNLHAQGKGRSIAVKTRTNKLKVSKRKPSTKGVLRTTSVPIERKENIYKDTEIVTPKPGSSNNTNSIPKHRPKSMTIVRNKLRKDSTLKTKGNSTNEKGQANAKNSGSNAVYQNKGKLKVDINSKLQTIKENKSKGKLPGNEDVKVKPKLQDINFVKVADNSKRLMAAFKKDSKPEDESDKKLITWNECGDGRTVFTSNKPNLDIQNIVSSQAGTSRASLRLNSYAKTTKLKRRNGPLRRLTTATDAPAKIDKLKKRKIIAKNQLT